MLNTKEGKGEGEGFNSLVFFFFHSSSLQNGKLLFLDLTMIAAKKKKKKLALCFLPFWPLLFDTKEKIFRCDF